WGVAFYCFRSFLLFPKAFGKVNMEKPLTGCKHNSGKDGSRYKREVGVFNQGQPQEPHDQKRKDKVAPSCNFIGGTRIKNQVSDKPDECNDEAKEENIKYFNSIRKP